MRLKNYKILLEQDKCLVLQPELAKLVGRSAALLFQQIHYWISSQTVKGTHYEGKKWIYNTYEGWEADLRTISKTTINRSIRKLKDFGLIAVAQFWARRGNRTNHYTINYDRLDELLGVSREKPFICVPTEKKGEPIQSNLDSPSIHNESFIYETKNTNKKNLINHNTSLNYEINCNKDNQELPKAQKMINTWNQIITPEIIATLTPKRAKFLIAALQYKFEHCLKKWEVYCQKIASSNFLMGKIKQGFKITLEIALKFDFIQKIFEKHFGIKDLDKRISFSEKDISPELHSLEMEKDITIRKKIFKLMGGEIYKQWFENISLNVVDEQVFIHVKSIFYRDWIINNYLDKLEKYLKIKFHIQIKV